MLEDFERFDLSVNGITVHGCAGGSGPPLLLLHGHPQTHVIWHRVAPLLCERFFLVVYAATNQTFASAYFHWFMLTQPAPLPERLIEADSDAWIEGFLGGRHAGLAPFAPEALAAYKRALAQPGAVHGMCEDYRASASIDLDHDRIDRDHDHRISCPLRVLWGEHGIIEKLFDPLTLWRTCAHDVSGHALPCGHYLPEEQPAP